ncbi:transposase [Streptomyces collinus]
MPTLARIVLLPLAAPRPATRTYAHARQSPGRAPKGRRREGGRPSDRGRLRNGDRAARRRRTQGTRHQEKWRLALGLLDTPSEWQLKAPVVVADAGYGVSTPFRLGLQ